MKVKVNIINPWSILMSDAVTMPSLTMVTSTVSEESLAKDTHTQTQSRVYVKVCFANNSRSYMHHNWWHCIKQTTKKYHTNPEEKSKTKTETTHTHTTHTHTHTQHCVFASISAKCCSQSYLALMIFPSLPLWRWTFITTLECSRNVITRLGKNKHKWQC